MLQETVYCCDMITGVCYSVESDRTDCYSDKTHAKRVVTRPTDETGDNNALYLHAHCRISALRARNSFPIFAHPFCKTWGCLVFILFVNFGEISVHVTFRWKFMNPPSIEQQFGPVRATFQQWMQLMGVKGFFVFLDFPIDWRSSLLLIQTHYLPLIPWTDEQERECLSILMEMSILIGYREMRILWMFQWIEFNTMLSTICPKFLKTQNLKQSILSKHRKRFWSISQLNLPLCRYERWWIRRWCPFVRIIVSIFLLFYRRLPLQKHSSSHRNCFESFFEARQQ